MAKCYRCGTTENLTDYEYWGRVEWYCDRCYDEMKEESRKVDEIMGEILDNNPAKPINPAI